MSRIEEEGAAVVLSEIGNCVEQVMCEIVHRYPHVNIDKHVIMPNHIHMIIMLQGDVERASVTDVVRMLKSIVGHRVKRGIFQRSFHDHMIRTDKDYHDIRYYIDNNPLTWAQDCFHPDSGNI